MGIRAVIADGLQSLATRMGTSDDKATSASYAFDPLRDDQIEAAFRSSWVCKKIVTIPSMDATRKWRQWNGDRTEDIEKLEDSPRIMLKAKVREAHWKSRLFGGSAILIGVGGPQEDFSMPLDPATIREGDLRYLAVLTRQDLTPTFIIDDPRHPRYGLAEHYTIATTGAGLFKIHPSRLVEFRGEPLPRWSSQGTGLYGWGDSVLQSVYEACRNLDSTMANVAALVFDAKTDVIKIPDLTTMISNPQYEEMLLRRFSTARFLKGNHGTLLLDAQEEYESKSYSFAGLDSIADRFMQIASGAADVPMTRLLGMSPGGLNSTGDGDLANYYDRISSIQSLEIEAAMSILDEVLIRSSGGDPEKETYEWRPLRQMSEDEISQIRSRDAETVSKLASSRIYSDEAVAELGAQLFQETGIDVLVDAERPEEEVNELEELPLPPMSEEEDA